MDDFEGTEAALARIADMVTPDSPIGQIARPSTPGA